MAKGKNHDEDPEDKSKGFNEDDDFSLPDFDLNDLDADSDDFGDDLSFNFGDLDEEETEKNTQVKASNPEPDSFKTLDEPISAPKEIFAIDEADLEAELNALDDDSLELSDEEIKAALNENEFYEEESIGDFQEETAADSIFSADAGTKSTTAAKPNPFDSMASSKVESPKKAPFKKTTYEKKEVGSSSGGGKFGAIVIVGVLVISAVAFALYMLSDSQPEPEPAPVVVAPPPAPPREEPKREEPKPSKPAPGTITTYEERTGKAYVVVNSFIDGDLAQDYANVLSAAGKSPYILAPVGSGKFYRVAIGEYNNFEQANSNKAQFNAEFGEDIWVLRY